MKLLIVFVPVKSRGLLSL